MEHIHDETQLQALMAGPALLVLFGGAHCGVCQALKPRIGQTMAEQFPDVTLAYVDCEQAPRVCAQQGVFTVPVLRFYVLGRLGFERARSFSVSECMADVARLMELAAQESPGLGNGSDLTGSRA